MANSGLGLRPEVDCKWADDDDVLAKLYITLLRLTHKNKKKVYNSIHGVHYIFAASLIYLN